VSRPEDDDRWHIELTPERSAQWSDYPIPLRMRRALKALLRSFGLRCTRLLRPEAFPPQQADEPNNIERRDQE